MDASQVVPQKKLTQHKAKIGNPIKLAFALIAVFIFDVNLQIGFNKRIVQHGLCIASQNEFSIEILEWSNCGKGKIKLTLLGAIVITLV